MFCMQEKFKRKGIHEGIMEGTEEHGNDHESNTDTLASRFWMQYCSHYLKDEVIAEMLPYCLNREVAVIAPAWTHKEGQFQNGQRNLRVSEAYMIPKIHTFKCENANVPMQWYYSLATYSQGLPFRNFLIPKEEKTHWIINHWRQMVAYDFCIDIDAPCFDAKPQALKDARRIMLAMSAWAKRIELRDSGKGYHLIVEYKDLPRWMQKLSFDPYHPQSIYGEYKKIAMEYYAKFSEMIDTSIYDSRRVVKIPGSLAIYEDRIVECQTLEIYEVEDENAITDGYGRDTYRRTLIS